MKIFGRRPGKTPLFERANSKSMGDLCFVSTAAMERGLDGSEERFADYFFSIYHCSPDEPAGINELREQLRQAHPTKVIQVGQRFVLSGQAAYLALVSYYQALSVSETLKDDFRTYARECLDRVTEVHHQSQSLPIPIDLTEGQLNEDHRVEFLTCIALRNGQVFPKQS
jgi:hypothetical protein